VNEVEHFRIAGEFAFNIRKEVSAASNWLLPGAAHPVQSGAALQVLIGGWGMLFSTVGLLPCTCR